ncbi:MAG: two-component sensor histidine kinase [Gemmatimonadetes bacterium]|nr:two-component sensor histidine kinase [Gemmatimonadota bacterium]|tara:strand:+ start:5539 stop:6891 length:1353 start_codon:yes stop_codon:yes gene_type:complete
MGTAVDEKVKVATPSQGSQGSTSSFRIKLSGWKAALSMNRWFGAYFFLSALVIILAFLVYTQIFVVQPVRQDARQGVKRLAFFYSIPTRDTIIVRPGPDLDIIFETIRNTRFPVVITDGEGTPHYWKAIGVPPDDKSDEAISAVRSIVRRLNMENPPYEFEIPMIGPNKTPAKRLLNYGHPPLVNRLAWLPWVALCVTGLFIGVGYLGFRNIKNSEQRSIWVGMARETAHQLGTPLSSLYGWIELMKAELQNPLDPADPKAKERFEQIVGEMEEDTSRLNKIASRFSLIGSTPELRLEDLGEVVEETASYLRERLSREIQITIMSGEVPPIPINRQLLGWAFENLLKNAADAMEGKGGKIEVSAERRQDGRCVDVYVRDNGKGIPPHLVKQIFLPGYSTKKRGWGLGLAFVKRIVEDYHLGKITVQESTPGVGTTFIINLPLAPPESRES